MGYYDSYDCYYYDEGCGLSTGAIVGIVFGSLVVVIGIGVGVFCWCRRRRRLAKADQDTYQTTLPTDETNGCSNTGKKDFTPIWNDPALLAIRINDEDIKDIKPIGMGAYGDVWLVKYRNTRLLAAKRLRRGETSQLRTQNFVEEIKLVAKLEHPKIVQFIGAAWTIEADLQAFFEYMEGGDLRVYLDNPMT
ncbi:Tkl protein kinase, partial [Globisporangium polare]